jgi:hypothetical protein
MKNARPGQLSVLLPVAMLEQMRGLAEITNCSIADLIRRAAGWWLVSDDARAMLKDVESSMKMQREISDLVERTNVTKKQVLG